MTSKSVRGGDRSEAKRQLAFIVGDLSGHLDHLKAEGVKQVECLPETGDGPDQSPPDSEISGKLAEIARAVAACKKCALHKARDRVVPGQGPIHPDILFVGEGPGKDEDREGIPFIGMAGKLLTRLITRMGYTRDEVFIANIVKCRPPDNRKPLPEEMAACFPYLQAQIALLKPRTIVALGATAVEMLVSPASRISRLRGTWHEFENIPLMPTYHPSYLLRNQSAMWDVWNDMQQVLTRLGRTPPPAGSKRK